MKLEPSYILTQINSKWVKDLNVRLGTETMKLLEENKGIKLLVMSLGNDFLEVTPTAQQTQK